MGLDGMRVGGGRCPPLFVGGLLLACLLLVCNWWSLSTENLELLRRIDELNELLKTSAEERDQCVTKREDLDKSYKRLEEEIGKLQITLQKQKDLEKQNSEFSEAVTICKSELDSLKLVVTTKDATMNTLRLENKALSVQVEKKNTENEKIESDLKTALNEIEKLKISVNAPKEKAGDLVQLTRRPLSPGQLEPVEESAVEISIPGHRGLKYYGIPILPRDPPGVTRKTPRLSVTKLKASPPNTIGQDTSANDGNANEDQDEDNAVDANANGAENRFAQPDVSSVDEKAEEEQP